MITLGLRYAARDRQRFILTAGGLTCAVTLAVFLVGVYRGAVHGSLDYIARADADVWVGSRSAWNLMRTSGFLPGSLRAQILAVDGVRQAEPILAGLVPATVHGKRRTLLVIGLDQDAALARPRSVVAGTGLPSGTDIVVDRAFARRTGAAIGQEIELAGHPVRVAGITTGTNLLVTQYAFVSRAELLRRLGIPNRATFFLVRAAPGRAADLPAALRAALPNAAVFDHATFLANNRAEIEAGFLPVLGAIAVLALLVGGIVVALTAHTAVLERRADFALLAALGATPGTRLGVVVQHALAAAVLGSAAALGLLLALQAGLPALVPEVEVVIGAGVGAAAVAGAAVMATLGAALPARLAMRVSPMEAFRR